MRRLAFAKGHGTGNDFVIVEDQHGMDDLDPETVNRLCDRHFGIGGDGLLRVVKARHIPGWEGDPDLWFMDYRNGDGSIAEMCGNGLRVFARYLMDEQLAPAEEFSVATRAGVKGVALETSGVIRTSLGEVRVSDDEVAIKHSGHAFVGRPVDVGNPHAVVFVPVETVASLDLHQAPTWEPQNRFQDGVNVEFVAVAAPGELQMRVHERGVGETLSCGTGVVAAAAVYRHDSGFDGPVNVTVPGGQLQVTFDGSVANLAGPAVVVARGEYWF